MSRLHLHILGSGSKGNCALIEGPQGLIMVDDGLSRRETLKRMAELGLSADNVSALLVTHEHSDHIKGLDVWCKHWRGPLFASRNTLASKESLAHVPVEEFDPGDVLEIAGVRIQTYSTSHDVINPVGYRFDSLGDSIGFATDTGELSSHAIDTLKDCRVLALESNHDVAMLRQGDYPRFLQERILSAKGHLSNDQAANAARELVTDRTEQLIAMHISQDSIEAASPLVDGDLRDVLLLDDLRNRNGQDAVSVLSRKALARGVLQIHATRRAVRAELLLQEVLTLVLLVLLDIHANGQATLVELNIDVVLGDAGQISLDLIAIALVLNVNGKRLRGDRVVCQVGHIIEQIEQRASRGTNAENRTIRNHACHVYHSFWELPSHLLGDWDFV